MHAAVGLANLKYLDAALADRERKYNIYKKELSKDSSLSFQKINGGCNYSYFPVVFKDEETLLKAQAKMNKEHIYPRRYFYPSVNTFSKLVPYVPMPESENLASRILCLPLYFTLEEKNMQRIIDAILK